MLFKSIKFNMNFSTYRFFKIKFIFIVFDGKEIVIKKNLSHTECKYKAQIIQIR